MEDQVLGLSKLFFTVVKTVPGKVPRDNVVPVSPSCKIELTAIAPQGPPAAATRTEAPRVSTGLCTEPLSRAQSWDQERESVSHSVVTLCDSMDCSPPSSSVQGFSWQVYWSGLPFLSPGDLPNPGMELGSPALQADSLPSELTGKPQKDKEEVRFYVN